MQLALERSGPRKIPLTPLVDVVFILLFFFMLASRPDQWRSLPVSLQSEARATSGGHGSPGVSGSEASESLVVQVSENGIALPGEGEISLGALIERLTRPHQADPSPERVVLVAMEGLRFQSLLTVSDALSATGVTVAFASTFEAGEN